MVVVDWLEFVQLSLVLATLAGIAKNFQNPKISDLLTVSAVVYYNQLALLLRRLLDDKSSALDTIQKRTKPLEIALGASADAKYLKKWFGTKEKTRTEIDSVMESCVFHSVKGDRFSCSLLGLSYVSVVKLS